MSASINDNVLEWSWPKNSGLSCYADTALWALLHKQDNAFYNLVNSTNDDDIIHNYNLQKKKKNCSVNDYISLKENILNFYNNILIPKQELKKYVSNIIGIFNNCFPEHNNNWLDECDANEFIQTLLRIHTIETTKNKINNSITYQGNENITQTDTNFYELDNPSDDPAKDDISEPTINNTAIINIQISPDSLNFKEITKTIDNKLIIKYPTENTDIKERESERFPNKLIIRRTLISTYTSDKNIDAFIINFTRMSNNVLGIIKKNDSPVNFPFKIGDLMLNSIIIHRGNDFKRGHYYCYFKHNNKWFKMDDTDGISKVNGEIYNEPNIFINCSTLVYYNASQPELDLTTDQYAHELFEKGKRQPLPRQPPLRQPPSRLAPSLTSTEQQGQLTDEEKVFTSQLQVTNNCEQHGKNWLELFVPEGKTAPISSSAPPLASASSGLIVPEIPKSVVPAASASSEQPEALPIPLTDNELSRLETNTEIYVARKKTGDKKTGDIYDYEKKVINNDTGIKICGTRTGDECGNTKKYTTSLYIFDDEKKATNFKDYMNANPNSKLPVATIQRGPEKPPAAQATEKPPPQVVLPAATKTPEAPQSVIGPPNDPPNAPNDNPKLGTDTQKKINDIIQTFKESNKKDFYLMSDIKKLDNPNVDEFMKKGPYANNKKCFQKDNNYYIPITNTFDKIKWYNIYTSKICNVGLDLCSDKSNDKFKGGSRKIRKINIKCRNKTRKGKRSKKGIRYKNKLLKCNKLKTNRLRRKKTKKNNFNKRTRKS